MGLIDCEKQYTCTFTMEKQVQHGWKWCW